MACVCVCVCVSVAKQLNSYFFCTSDATDDSYFILFGSTDLPVEREMYPQKSEKFQSMPTN